MAKLSTHLGKADWEVPFGRVIYGDDALESINTEYDDNISQGRIWKDGYDYLKQEFPNLSYIKYCRVIHENEINYYLQSINNQHPNIQNEQQHDLQKQLYDDSNSNLDIINSESITLILECIACVIFIVGFIFAVIKLIKKTPDKNN